jgi:rhodanese-related sulfurtransferase
MLCLLAFAVSAVAEDVDEDYSGYYAPIWMPVESMSKEELRDMLGQKNLVIADVRYFAPLDEGKIPGAVRYHPMDVETWGPTIPENATVVIY